MVIQLIQVLWSPNQEISNSLNKIFIRRVNRFGINKQRLDLFTIFILFLVCQLNSISF